MSGICSVFKRTSTEHIPDIYRTIIKETKELSRGYYMDKTEVGMRCFGDYYAILYLLLIMCNDFSNAVRSLSSFFMVILA